MCIYGKDDFGLSIFCVERKREGSSTLPWGHWHPWALPALFSHPDALWNTSPALALPASILLLLVLVPWPSDSGSAASCITGGLVSWLPIWGKRQVCSLTSYCYIPQSTSHYAYFSICLTTCDCSTDSYLASFVGKGLTAHRLTGCLGSS